MSNFLQQMWYFICLLNCRIQNLLITNPICRYMLLHKSCCCICCCTKVQGESFLSTYLPDPTVSNHIFCYVFCYFFCYYFFNTSLFLDLCTVYLREEIASKNGGERTTVNRFLKIAQKARSFPCLWHIFLGTMS